MEQEKTSIVLKSSNNLCKLCQAESGHEVQDFGEANLLSPNTSGLGIGDSGFNSRRGVNALNTSGCVGPSNSL